MLIMLNWLDANFIQDKIYYNNEELCSLDCVLLRKIISRHGFAMTKY